MSDPKQASLFDGTALAAISTKAVAHTQITVQRLLEVKKLLDESQPDPLEKYMRDLGYPPERYDLILPERLRADLGPFPPYFVKFSASTQIPLIAPRLGLTSR